MAELAKLFATCDSGGKGYLTMEDFTSIVPDLSTSEVGYIFDQLDTDGDSKVTLEDFQDGFERVVCNTENPQISRRTSIRNFRQASGDKPAQKSRRRGSNILPRMDSLPCSEDVSALYSQIQDSGVPSLLTQFEAFMANVSKEMKEQKDHNQQLKKLYDKEKEFHQRQIDEVESELEQQIRLAAEQARKEERDRLEREKDSMRRQMEEEIEQLQTNIKKLQKVEKVLNDNNPERAQKVEEMKQRLQDLSNENRSLKTNLSTAHTTVALVKAEMVNVKNEYEEKCLDLVTEKEALIEEMHAKDDVTRQLQLLHNANKRLHDTNDNLRTSLESRTALVKKYNLRSPSPLSASSDSDAKRPSYLNIAPYMNHIEEDDADSGMPPDLSSGDDMYRNYIPNDELSVPGTPPYDRRTFDEPGHNFNEPTFPSLPGNLYEDTLAQRNGPSNHTRQDSIEATGPPERSFRVVMAGDASVGKSSFITRLCKDKFEGALPSTLGVDFHVKNCNVDGTNVALQLWDTAGQERFRSLCKSYFRRADGAIMIYDCTCEISFLNVRSWIETIKENARSDIPILICANKIDARLQAEASRKPTIKTDDGQSLAKHLNQTPEHECNSLQSYGALFCEISCKEGTNIRDSMLMLSRDLLLMEHMESQLSSVMLKEKAERSKKCCS